MEKLVKLQGGDEEWKMRMRMRMRIRVRNGA